MSYIIKYFYNFYSRRHCIYIRKNTKETKQVDYTQISVKIYSTYLYQEEHQGNEASRLHTNFGQNLQHIFISGRTPRKRSRSITHKFRSKFTAHIYIRKNTKETKQVDYTQTSVKIYSTYLYQEEHQGNKTGRLHTNFGQNLQHIFISGRTPRKRSKSITHKLRSKFTAHIYIRKNTKETKQVDYTQISVKIYSTYLQHIFISGRTPRRLKRKNENGNNVCNTAHATQQTQSKRRISCRKI